MDFQPMTPDEMQRTMQFLLSQQAQFAADMDRLSEKTDRIAEGLIGLTALVGRLAEETSQQFRETDQRLRETDQRLRETDQRLREADAHLTEQNARTEAHLNILIGMFERHLQDSHGDRPS